MRFYIKKKDQIFLELSDFCKTEREKANIQQWIDFLYREEEFEIKSTLLFNAKSHK